MSNRFDEIGLMGLVSGWRCTRSWWIVGEMVDVQKKCVV